MTSAAMLRAVIVGFVLCSVGAATAAAPKTRIIVVDSYHPEYLWSQDTQAGVVAALLEHGYLDDESQADEYSRLDYVESSTAIVKKLWMDTKRKNARQDLQESIARVVQEIDRFAPDLVLLGDDNATNYIGSQYVDTDIPVVFWGVNGNPLAYHLLDSLEAPGHNVTGVYQAGYLREGVIWLKRRLPELRTIAVLSDESETGRVKAKELARLARQGELPVTIVDIVVTDSWSRWKARALELQPKVDAFFVLNHNTLRDDEGRLVDQMDAGAWYLRHIHRPDVSHERHFVLEGMLCAVDDSGYKQGYEAMQIGHRIVSGGEAPAAIPVRAPERGAFVVNLQRAADLGLDTRIAASPLIEERIDKAMALQGFR